MSLKASISEDMKAAMKAREAQRLSAIRLLLAAIKQREVDERKELSDAEIAQEVSTAIAQTGAKGVADMGKVMGALKGKLAGRADMGKISSLVKSKLAG
ncbi:MAG TPA: GatB/YqeY domain-containing protein [Burkholderiales bacterium]|nr:GatB/YqeY domain-containing protein [Burkholderiales bacterium]